MPPNNFVKPPSNPTPAVSGNRLRPPRCVPARKTSQFRSLSNFSAIAEKSKVGARPSTLALDRLHDCDSLAWHEILAHLVFGELAGAAIVTDKPDIDVDGLVGTSAGVSDPGVSVVMPPEAETVAGVTRPGVPVVRRRPSSAAAPPPIASSGNSERAQRTEEPAAARRAWPAVASFQVR